MFTTLVAGHICALGLPPPPPPLETPATGCLHPDAPGRYFKTPGEYWAWYRQHGRLAGTDAPVVAVLLYRKHVITEQVRGCCFVACVSFGDWDGCIHTTIARVCCVLLFQRLSPLT
jgi:hypothetical protein